MKWQVVCKETKPHHLQRISALAGAKTANRWIGKGEGAKAQSGKKKGLQGVPLVS